MRARRAILALAQLLALAAGARALAGQQVIGTIQRSGDSIPVAGALVVLTDAAGGVVARVISGERGSFAVVLPAGGRYGLRVLRIGHQPWDAEPVVVPATGRAAVRLFIEERPITLPTITVAAERPHCGFVPPGSALALLLAEAHKAITLTQTTLDERRLLFDVLVWRRRLAPNLATLDSFAVASTDRGWPIRSAPPESLRVWGFVRNVRDIEGRLSATYYGPDARVLFADWFLGTRCLRLVAARAGRPGLITVEFTPQARRPGVDLAGEFVFDSTSLELRELQFRWVGLARWVPEAGPGGLVRFLRLPGGEWLPTEWSLRAPVPGMGPDGVRLHEYAEFGGRAFVIPAPVVR